MANLLPDQCRVLNSH